jgi:hypothetical protein
MDIYVKFVKGGGFQDQVLGETVINSKGERANSLLSKFTKDLKYFNGFACLVKYDGLGMPYEYFSIPFEHCRLEIESNGDYTGRIAVHQDWTGITGKRFRQDDVQFLNHFNPKAVLTEMLEVGTPVDYKGQVYYFTSDGELEYPISPFDPIITDMLTEESVSTVKHRNAKYNFLSAGMLVRKGRKPRTLDNGVIDPDDPYNLEQAESAAMIKKWQGDENAAKMLVVDIDADEEEPVFRSFVTNNYDKQYELTEKTVQENVGKMFMIPPILRGIDVGAGFGAELMNNAYDFMNSLTGDERKILEVTFRDLLQFYMIQFTNFTINPLLYITPKPTVQPSQI